jgi:rubrerythrin
MAFLSASDIVDLAMQLEQSGEAFYRAVARKAQSSDIRTLFEYLADEEVKHYRVFSKLGQQLANNPLMTDEEWEQYMQYLGATVQSAFFEGPDKALAAAEEATDEKEAVRMAMAFEKETLLFFYDLKDVVPAADQTFIEKVIAQEKTHVRRLAEMLQ